MRVTPAVPDAQQKKVKRFLVCREIGPGVWAVDESYLVEMAMSSECHSPHICLCAIIAYVRHSVNKSAKKYVQTLL